MSEGIVSKPGRSGAMTLNQTMGDVPVTLDPVPPKSKLTHIAAAVMALGSMIPSAYGMEMVQPRPRKQSKRTWTCKRCGSSFHPSMSPTICDECHKQKHNYGIPTCEECKVRSSDVKLVKHIHTSVGWIELTRYTDLCTDCQHNITAKVDAARAEHGEADKND